MQTILGLRAGRFAAALALAMAWSPGFAAGGGGHGGMAGGGGRGPHGDLFHVRGGARPERAAVGQPGERPSDAVRDAEDGRGAIGGRGVRGVAGRRARLAPRRPFVRDRRLRLRRCSPSLAERHGPPHGCDGASPYGRR